MFNNFKEPTNIVTAFNHLFNYFKNKSIIYEATIHKIVGLF